MFSNSVGDIMEKSNISHKLWQKKYRRNERWLRALSVAEAKLQDAPNKLVKNSNHETASLDEKKYTNIRLLRRFFAQ